ncbi:four helix bundle protein [Maribacter algarum]|uniref:Four helix bundle protein n=1 Tax=Maribacter algarum (ex Zhang et al. 2020) TaxID=2578118 RepID=A0A5S3PV51_9FLAO|nr:four helix bundle protein [Maribacter algarum]TMM58843.1 four helix bundle protein [Maribacter algarum]
MAKYTSFEDLEVYKAAIEFTIEIFELLKKEEFKKEWAFTDQLKRATLSISNNIAEGFERETDKELIRFLYFSKGSAGEVRNIINVLKTVKYITPKEADDLKNDISGISKQLSNYIKYVKKRNDFG